MQLVYAFTNGLPLTPARYQWEFEVEGQHRKGWTCEFYVPGPPPAPVFGGLSDPAPADLPRVQGPEED